jgi:hypothetical protein
MDIFSPLDLKISQLRWNWYRLITPAARHSEEVLGKLRYHISSSKSLLGDVTSDGVQNPQSTKPAATSSSSYSFRFTDL